MEPKTFGRFRLLRTIANGGFGVVYEASSPEFGDQRLALKTLRPEAIDTEVSKKRLLHEATVARAIDHPNVVRVLDAGFEEDQPFIVMGLIEGWPLSKLLRHLTSTNQRLDWRVAVNLLLGAVSGLDAIHRATHPQTGEPLGIVHRDLAPKNLMVDERGELVVIDLGLGKSNLQDWATRTGVIMGTPGYMSPEQIRGQRTDARSDVYSIGVVCFELLTMEPLIEPGEVHDLAARALHGAFRPLTAIRSDVPFVFNEILARALAVDPSNRLESMAVLAERLRETVRDSGALLRDTELWAQFKRAEPLTEPERARTELPTEPTLSPEPPTRPVAQPNASAWHPSVRWLIGPLLAAGLLFGIVVGLQLLSSPLTVIEVAPSRQGNSPAAPIRGPVIAERPLIAPPPTVAPAPEPSKSPTSIAPRRPKPEAVVPAPPPPLSLSPPSASAQVDALVARASRLKKERPELAGPLNRLIGDVTMWRAAEDEGAATSALQKAEARLLEIEKGSVEDPP